MKCDVETKALHEQVVALTKERDEANDKVLRGGLVRESLALPTDDTALQQRLAEERERCALCVEAYDMDSVACARAIRSMK